MYSLKKLAGQCGPAFLAVLVVGLLLSGPKPATLAQASVTESTFANNVNQPVGVAATPGRLLVTHPFCGNPREVLSIDSTGTVSGFATLPDIPLGTCVEDYITIAQASPNLQSVPGFPTPNPAGFKSNFVYVTQGPTIFQIALDGTRSTFATISSCPALGGITFDRVGPTATTGFRFQLIAVCSSPGQVWLLGASPGTCPSASCQLIATVPTTNGEVVEGPDVAPSTTPLPGLAGQLLVTVAKPQRGGGKIFAVSPPPSSVVTQVTTSSSPESIAFIPTTKCAFGLATALPTYFTAVFGGNTVDFLPLKDPNTGMGVFTGLSGNALIATEQDGITLLSSVNGKIATSTFERFFAQHQGSAFVDCTTPLLLTSSRESGPLNIGPGASGEITVRIFVTPNFNPLTICVGNTTADGSQICPPPLNSPPTYGVTGTEHSFDRCQPNLVATGSGPALECKFFKALLNPTSISNFTGTLIIKLFYLGPTGDGEADGGN